MPPRVLLIDDSPDDRRLALRSLEGDFAGLEAAAITDRAGLDAAIAAGGFDAVITEHRLGWSTGLDVLRAVKAARPDTPVIMLTATGSEEAAVEAMKAGLDDYVVKSPRHYPRLPAALRAALEAGALRGAHAERDRALADLQQVNETLERRVAERTEQLRGYQRQLRAMTAQLTNAEQRERRRVAEALHDHLSGLLAAIKTRLAVLHAGVPRERMIEEAERAEALLEDAMAFARTLTMELSPPMLDEQGLEAALRWLAEEMPRNHALAVRLDVRAEVDPLAEELRVLLFQSVRELLLNVSKHAGVAEAEVTLDRSDGEIAVTVADAGRGFDLHTSGARRGFGLFNIGERLDHMGGRVEIASAPGQGTRVRMVAPAK